jgi:hypothetical protein
MQAEQKATIVKLSPDTLSVMQSVVCDSLRSSCIKGKPGCRVTAPDDVFKGVWHPRQWVPNKLTFQTNMIFIRSHTEEWYEESNFATAADPGFQFLGGSRI